MVIFSFSSLAVGMVAVATAGILFTFLFRRPLKISVLYLYLIVLSTFSIIISFQFFNQPLNFKHLSLIAIFVTGVGSAFFLNDFTNSYLSLDNSYKLIYFYFILVLIGLLGIFFPFKFGSYALANHPVFPFSEPSHFSLIYGPISCMALSISGTKMRKLIILITFALSLALPSTTLLLFALLISLINFSLIVLLFIFAILTFSIYISIPLDFLTYFSDRLTSDNSENLSRLVYIQGWENMFSALLSTNGIGIGFQNFGNEPAGDASLTLSILTESGLNRSDGGFLLAKFIGEFGIIGVFAMFFLLLISISSGFALRKRVLGNLSNSDLTNPLPLCILYTIVIEFLIRGIGYFSPMLFLAIFALPRAIAFIRKNYSNPLKF
jgi:hypothetical protein